MNHVSTMHIHSFSFKLNSSNYIYLAFSFQYIHRICSFFPWLWVLFLRIIRHHVYVAENASYLLMTSHHCLQLFIEAPFYQFYFLLHFSFLCECIGVLRLCIWLKHTHIHTNSLYNVIFVVAVGAIVCTMPQVYLC